jgi:hypothetical protein
MTLDELVSKATPRPWVDNGYSDMGHTDTFGCNIGDGEGGLITWSGHEGLEGAIPSHDDAALIVLAVNNIEAITTALRSLVDVVGKRVMDGELAMAWHDAAVAIRNLDGESA